MSEMHQSRITELALKSLENQITPEEFAELDSYLAASKENAGYFTDCLTTYMAISEYHEVTNCKVSCFSEGSFDRDLWRMLSETEMSAPAITSPKEEPKRQPVPKVVYEKVPARVNKISLIAAVSCAAALLFLLVFIQFTNTSGGPEVARLADTVNAKWGQMVSPVLKGDRLSVPGYPMFLQEGIVELLFDNDARVVIEAPAEFQILAEDRIGLQFGKLYATVPQEAIGFSVYTENAKIVDLGTEFGVQVDQEATTELHVIKGRINLLAGATNKVSMNVHQGNAKAVSANSAAAIDIPLRETKFIRNINSKTNTVWRGQKQIDLADYVGGGNGFGTGALNFGIDPVTGELCGIKTINRTTPNVYKVVPGNPFVDGVFVPNGKDTQVISSQGHVFQECPVTQGIYFTEILNTPSHLDEQKMVLNNVAYDTRENPCLFMHANLGITFDLDAVRAQTPGARIARFQSLIGISETALRDFTADFWVLVDGQLQYKREQVQQEGLLDALDIELADTDRFLTLVVTDGGDPAARMLPDGFIRQSIDCDWGMFAAPVLVLE